MYLNPQILIGFQFVYGLGKYLMDSHPLNFRIRPKSDSPIDMSPNQKSLT